MISLQFFLSDEMYSSIIICKIVGHGLDLLFDLCLVCALFRYHKALSGMLLSGGQNRILTVSDSFQCGLYGNGILLGILDTGDTTDGIGMSLADTLTPEGIIAAVS